MSLNTRDSPNIRSSQPPCDSTPAVVLDSPTGSTYPHHAYYYDENVESPHSYRHWPPPARHPGEPRGYSYGSDRRPYVYASYQYHHNHEYHHHVDPLYDLASWNYHRAPTNAYDSNAALDSPTQTHGYGPSCAPPTRVTPQKPARGNTDMHPATESSSNGNENPIWELLDTDIVCGRGAPVNWQEGNQIFRQLIEDHQTTYLCAKRCDKPRIASEILEAIKARGGRFVRRIKTSYGGRFGWEEIEEKRAYEKVCQALREGAPELRRRMIRSANVLARSSSRGRSSPPFTDHRCAV